MASLLIVVVTAFLGSATGSQVTFLPHGNMVRVKEKTPFQAFVLKHQREYKHDTAEYAMREGLFQQRLAAVHAQNAQPDRLWDAAANHFSDRTEAELKVARGYRRHLRASPWGGEASASLQQMDQIINKSTELPASKDWTHLKAAHPAKDQGSCGSCWAVATQSILEAHHEIFNKKTRSFSAQEIIECTPNLRSCGGTGGCEGATVELALDHIVKNGLSTEEDVPYRGQDSACPTKKELIKTDGGASFGLVSYKTLKVNDDHDLAAHLVHFGPVGVSACAGSWFGYSSGIFNGGSPACTVDHAITLYGYGEEEKKDPSLVEGAVVKKNKKTKFWNIRNSWGSSWGEKGYIRLLRQDVNDKSTIKERHCGMDNNMQDGVGCKGDPTSAQVCGSSGILSDSALPIFKGSPGNL